MSIRQFIQSKRQDILRVASQHGASNVRLFGSVVRDEASPDSDVDLLVEMAPDRSLLDRVALKQDLEALLGHDVDVLTDRSLHWLLRRRILKEAKPL